MVNRNNDKESLRAAFVSVKKDFFYSKRDGFYCSVRMFDLFDASSAR